MHLITQKQTPGQARTREDVLTRLDSFLSKLQEKIEMAHKANGFTFPCAVLSFDYGQKNVKVVRADVDGSNRSVYGFIDLATGDIYKAAGWKAPAKGVRGNIFSDDFGLSCCGPYGVAYLR